MGHNLNYTKETGGGPYTQIYTYTIYSTPPAIEAAPVTQRLERNSSKVEVGNPFVITSAKLLSGRHMENPHASKSHLLAHEVNVQLDVFRPAMMNGVGG